MDHFEGYDPDNLYPASMVSSVWNVSYQAEWLGEWIWQRLQPKTVIDLGCGPGCYLLPFVHHGCQILGLDACEAGGGLIPGRFERVDLRFPYIPASRFDLALCTEVAEHLENQYGDTLLDSLVSCSDLILFSAAVPGQPGQYHVNLQPPEYWLAKFAERGYGVHALHSDMRTFLMTLRPSTPQQTDGCHAWLRDHSYLLGKLDGE